VEQPLHASPASDALDTLVEDRHEAGAVDLQRLPALGLCEQFEFARELLQVASADRRAVDHQSFAIQVHEHLRRGKGFIILILHRSTTLAHK